jgi:hypothetical protein
MVTDETDQNPFARPGFVLAALLVILLVVVGIVVAVSISGRDDNPNDPMEAIPAPTTTTAPDKSANVEPSTCGLPGEVLSGTLSIAPEAEWSFQGTTAYPTSSEYGPGESSPVGVRSCFQHSPTGAVFAAANAVVQATDPATTREWLAQFLADSPARNELLEAATGSTDPGSRVQVSGFRLLTYDGKSASVDVAVRGSSGGQTVNLSMVYNLVWEAGDWKLWVDDVAAPINVATVPDLAGYISWGE